MELNIDKSQWVKVQFGDVVQKVSNKIDPETYHSEIVLQGGHINKRDFHIREYENKNELGYLGPAFHMGFKKHQILYVSRNPHLMKVGYPHFDGICANTTFIMETKNESVLRNDLILFIMHSDTFIEQSVANVRGGVNPYVNWSDLACIEFLLPPKEQQDQLAKLLWAMDEVIENIIGNIEANKRLQSSAVKELCLKNSRSKKMKLDSLIDHLEAGVSVNSEEGEVAEGDYGILKTSSVSMGYFIPTEVKKVVQKDQYRLKAPVRKNTIIISRMNTVELVGANAFVDDKIENTFLPDRLWQTQISNLDVNVKYLWYILSSPNYRSRISDLCTGTSNSMKNISKKSFLNIEVPLPMKVEQDKIVQKLDIISSSTKSMEKYLIRSKSLLKSLINQVF